MTEKTRVTAIRIKAELAIPTDVANIEEFQVAAAKANQIKVLMEEIGVCVSFESKIGNVEVDQPAPVKKEPDVTAAHASATDQGD